MRWLRPVVSLRPDVSFVNPRSHSQGWLPCSGLTVPLLHCWHSPLTRSLWARHSGMQTAAPASDEELMAHGRHARTLPVLLLKVDGGHAKQLLLSVDGSKPAAHWQARSHVVETLTALATQAQSPGTPPDVALLRGGQAGSEM